MLLSFRGILRLREQAFSDETQGTQKIIGEVFELRSGSNTALGAALFFVIGPSANITDIFHNQFLLNHGI